MSQTGLHGLDIDTVGYEHGSVEVPEAAVYLRLAAEVADMLAAGLERDKPYIDKLMILMDSRRKEK